MRQLIVPIGPQGAFVQVEIGVSAPHRAALRRAGLPVPHAVRIPMLIDTGASHTFIDGTILTEQLQLTSTAKYTFHSATTQAERPEECAAFPVSLALGGQVGQYPWRFGTFEVMGSMDRRAHGLLGCDILRRAHLEWKGPQGELVLLWD